ncbi:unnamed protein product [Trifolium pratense]|uniref:Uncharacterized protein n=1 Tax=Trifolium pratense TaxID=57577 RepID=A0ACB0LU61_TRIPR|nr:unnamed protein product [Trifolium pratense]
MLITSQLVLSFCLIQWGFCAYICVGYPLITDAHNALHEKVLKKWWILGFGDNYSIDSVSKDCQTLHWGFFWLAHGYYPSFIVDIYDT